MRESKDGCCCVEVGDLLRESGDTSLLLCALRRDPWTPGLDGSDKLQKSNTGHQHSLPTAGRRARGTCQHLKPPSLLPSLLPFSAILIVNIIVEQLPARWTGAARR